MVEKNKTAVELGRLGGLKGGPARAKKLSPEQRKEIAQKAAKVRWNKNIKKYSFISQETIQELKKELIRLEKTKYLINEVLKNYG